MKHSVRLLLLAALAGGALGQVPAACGPAPPNTPLTNAEEIPGFCPYVWAANLAAPRSLLTLANGDVLTVESQKAQVTVLWDANGDGQSDAQERATLAQAPSLNHAVEYHAGYLYASNPTTVFRWAFTVGNRSALGSPTTVVQNIPCCHHVTRTLRFGPDDGALYVQVGSSANVETDTSHTEIRIFNVNGSIPAGGLDWSTGRLFASGLRNEVGLRFDAQGRLWGVENGVDDLNRPDLGGDIHNDNPCEELNLFAQPGRFYGYPYCWSEWRLAANQSKPVGAQWAHPQFMSDGTHTDQWCDDDRNVVKPAYCFQAHFAPLDVYFWDVPAWPQPFAAGAFVASHGSWDRQPPAGYQVVHVAFQGGLPASDRHFLHAQGPDDKPPRWAHRPVGLTRATCPGFKSTDCLLISSDASGVIMAMAYNG